MTKPQAEKKKTKKAAKAAVKKHTGAKKEAASKPKGGRAAGQAPRRKDSQASYSTSARKGKSHTGRTDRSAAKKLSAHRSVDGDTGPPPEQKRRVEQRSMPTQQRHSSGSSGGGSIDYDDLPDTLKARFTQDEYATLVEKQREWETSLARADFNTIDAKLVAAGLPPLRTPDMANAMLDFMADPATEVRRQLPLLRDFKQPSSEPVVDVKHTGERAGREQFDEAVLRATDDLLRQKNLSKQDTVALVLAAASGTGKTFSVLSFPPVAQSTKHPDAKFVLAYIGFNISWPIESSSEEEKLLVGADYSDPSTKQLAAAQDAVSKVILARLLGVLQQMINHHDKLEGTPGFSSPVVDYTAPSGYTTAALRQVVVEKALQLQSEGFPKNRLVVVTNLDEAQVLDELCGCWDEDGPNGGARFGLRVLRQLQRTVYNASNGKCLLLPIATGIDPFTTLLHKTDGWNTPIDVTLLTLDEFTALTEEHYNDADVDLSSVKQFAAAAYPRVREMMGGSGIVSPIDADLTPVSAAKILHCSFSGDVMPKKEIPNAIYAIGSQKKARPVLDLAVWPSVVEALRLSVLPFALPMNFQSGCDNVEGFAEFEKSAFHVTGFILKLLHKESTGFYPKETDAGELETFESELTKFKTAFVDHNSSFVRAWGGATSGMSRFVRLREETRHYHPFKSCDNHDAAAAGGLSTEFIHELKKLTEVKSLSNYHNLLLWMGGRAPFDYMMVHVQDRKSKRLAIALGDAKHKSDPTAKEAARDVVHDAKELAKKAVPWIEAIKRELTQLRFVVEPSCPVSLITNVPMPAFAEYDVPCQFTDKGGVAHTVDVIVLSPSNLHFPPWTDVLFRCDHQRADS